MTINYTASHDYDSDTKMTYEQDATGTHLKLWFTSEDPDCGTEEMEYNTDGWWTPKEIGLDLLDEIKSYLDAQDTSSFLIQQGVPVIPAYGYFDDFTRTALYAFENILQIMFK